MKSIIVKFGVGLAAILAIILLAKNRFLSVALTAIVAAVLGAVTAYFLLPQRTVTVEKIVEKKCPEQIKYIDTCLYMVHTDTIAVHNTVKKGTKTQAEQTETKLEPQTEVAIVEDIRIYTKYLNTGLMHLWDTVKVQDSRIVDWDRAYLMDTVTLNTLVKTVEKIVLQPSVTKETIYAPTENTAHYLGLAGTFSYDGEPIYGVGLNYRVNRFDVSLTKSLNNVGGSVGMNIPLFKVNK